MEKGIAKPSPEKESTSSDVTAITQHGEKSPPSDVSPAKSPENTEKNVSTKEVDIPTAPAHFESLGTDVVSQDDIEEEEIHLRLQPSDEEMFEDTVEDVSELMENETSAVEKYFSDIESSDNSQVYEPKSKRGTSVEAGKAVSKVCKVINIKGLNKEKSELDFEPVESEEDFEESRSQEEAPLVLQREEDFSDIETQSQVKEESNGSLEAEIDALLSPDKEGSKGSTNEANKESTSSAAMLLENEKKAPEECLQETMSVSVPKSVDGKSDDVPETTIPDIRPESPTKSQEAMEASDSLAPLETNEILANEQEPAQEGRNISEETEEGDAMEVGTDLPSLDVKEKVSVEDYESPSESIHDVVESQEAMEVGSGEADSNKKHIAVGDDEKSQPQANNQSLSETRELLNEQEPRELQETFEKSRDALEVLNEEETKAPEDNKSLGSPTQLSTSFENLDISVDVHVPTETSIESLKAAEKSEACADPTESETSSEPPISPSNEAQKSENTVTSSIAGENSETITGHSTEKLLETSTKFMEVQQTSQVTVEVVEKSQENQQHMTEAQESLTEVEKIPSAAVTAANDESKKEDSIEDDTHLENSQLTLETAKNSMQVDEECEDVLTEIEKSKLIAEEHKNSLEESVVENFWDKTESSTNADKSSQAVKSPEMEQIKENPTGTATSSDILMDTDLNSPKAIDACANDSTVVDDLPNQPEKLMDTDGEDSDKAQKLISEPAKASELATILEGNVNDSDEAEKSQKTDERTTESSKTLESAQKLDGNVEDSTKGDKPKQLDEEKPLDESAVESAKSDELSEKSSAEKSLEKRKETETDSSEKPLECDGEVIKEAVSFSIGNSAQNEAEAKVSAVESENSVELSEKSSAEKSLEKRKETETDSSEKPLECDGEVIKEAVSFSIGNSAQNEAEAKVSAVESENSDELSEKSSAEKSLEKPKETETDSSEKPLECDGEVSKEAVSFSIGNSAQNEAEEKVSKPKDEADINEIVVEDVSELSKEENAAKQPVSIDPEIIEIDDDDLEDNKIKDHTTASDTQPPPIEGKEDDAPPEVNSKQVVADKLELEQDKPLSEVAVPIEKTTEKGGEVSTEKPPNSSEVIESAVPEDIEMLENIDKDKNGDLKQSTGDEAMKAPETASAQAPPDDDESLLMIDTSHKEDNEPDDNDMDTEAEQTATSAPTTTDSSSEGSLEVFYDKECVHYECKHGSKNFYRATLFTLNYYKISRKRNKAQYVCEECYDRALSSYEEMCKTLTKKQPLLHGATFKGQEFVEIIDSSEEDDDEGAGDTFKDENALPKDSIELLEAELEGAIRKVMHNVDIQNQLSWTKQILQQRLNNLQEDTEFVSVQLRQLQKKADNMHNSLYQCPKIKIRQLTPLDLNSGRTYNPETESTIPPMGEVLRASIHVNETYYAVKNKAIASWVPCKVIEAVDSYSPYSKSQKHFKIKFLKSKYPMLKTVSAKHMAFFNPPKVRLPIGTRVIAYFDVTSLSRGKEKMLIPSAFYPGIIAEPLKQSNKFRYLVFYDDGYFQYVYHKDVRLVCQASENVWEDVHHQSREFIHNYLTQYAVNRPMVQTQKGQSMLVDYNGKWIYARVIDVDCSLVQMLFEGQSRSEWIYRGSTRLGPVYKESNSLVQKNQTNTSRISRRTEPFIRYINGDDSSSSQQSQEQPPQQSQPKTGEVRSVAKKSVSKTDNSHQSTQPVPTVRHLNNSTIFVDDDNKPKGKVVYYTARKNLPPRDYIPHICSPTCPFNVTHNLSFYSPLAKPLLSGWERQVFRQKSKKFIVYRGPCGKRLRSMEELHRYLRVTENELNVDNFDFSAETNCLAEYVIESCIVQKKDISNGKEKMPIPCVNYYDNTMPPDCVYSSRRIPTEGVPLNLDKDFLVGCDCEDDCSDKSKCSCWELTYAGAKYGMPNVPNEMVGYQYKRLYEHVPTGIYECNARCKCKANCVNRVVQQPLQSKLQVFKTSNRGWGLRCINDVPRGSFICIYAGHLLNEQKANEGGLDAGDEYFAELDYIEVAEQIKEGYESDVIEPDEDEDLYNPDKEDEDDDEFVAPGESHRNRSFNTRSRSRRSTKNSSDVEHDSQERQVISFEPNKTMGQPDNSTSEKPTIRKLFGKDEACYIMDAKITGNLGRYFNHSCSPNLFVQNVFVDTHDLRFPWVAFFAFTHIRAGTELTWNYNYEVGVVPGKVLYCQCGAPNCRQRLL